MSSNNLCFGANIQNCILIYTPVLLYKSDMYGGHSLNGHVYLMINESFYHVHSATCLYV